MSSEPQAVVPNLSAADLGTEDRRIPDRRKQSTPMFSRYAFFGGRRRSSGRRRGEPMACFVDEYGSLLFLVVLSIITLNFLDAWFTIYFLSHGGTELNPLVGMLLQGGTWPFVLAKSLGIGICVGVLTLTKNFKVARAGLAVVLCGYSLLLCWHLTLLLRMS